MLWSLNGLAASASVCNLGVCMPPETCQLTPGLKHFTGLTLTAWQAISQCASGKSVCFQNCNCLLCFKTRIGMRYDGVCDCRGSRENVCALNRSAQCP